jgi:hypothetical protein
MSWQFDRGLLRSLVGHHPSTQQTYTQIGQSLRAGYLGLDHEHDIEDFSHPHQCGVMRSKALWLVPVRCEGARPPRLTA